MGRKFLDDVATIATNRPLSFEDEQPTNARGHQINRTILDLADPEPTIPPEPTRATPMPVPMPHAPSYPPAVGRYAIERQIGQGAFGKVFVARDTKLGRQVALKILHPQQAASHEIRLRFVQEAHAAACINHPGIVTVFDAGELEGTATAFIAMELLAGESLHARLARGGALSSLQVRELGRQIASTLGAAHRAGVIHRDLKPENIFLVPDPAAADGERVKILDFGLAKPTLTASVQTHAMTVFGTPAYMSPEQCESTRDIDARSDIYALGCVLYQMLCLRAPFEGSMRELVLQHRTAPPPPLRTRVRDVDPALEALIMSMLAKLPSDRPQTMADVERLLRASTDAEETREMQAMPREVSRTPRGLGVALIALATGLAVCISAGLT